MTSRLILGRLFSRFIFKEWVRDTSIVHRAAEASDRYLTGDDLVYLDAHEARSRVAAHFGAGAMLDESRIAPWRNNMALIIHADA